MFRKIYVVMAIFAIFVKMERSSAFLRRMQPFNSGFYSGVLERILVVMTPRGAFLCSFPIADRWRNGAAFVTWTIGILDLLVEITRLLVFRRLNLFPRA